MLIVFLHSFHDDNLHGDLRGKIKAAAPADLHTTFFFIVTKLEVRLRSSKVDMGLALPVENFDGPLWRHHRLPFDPR